jgi:hypothetical protein
MQAPGCTRHPTRPTPGNRGPRWADRRVEEVHRRPRKRWILRAPRNLSSASSASRELLVLERPGSSPPSILSVGYANTPIGFPPGTLVFSDEARQPPSYRERLLDLTSFGGAPSPTLPPGTGSAESDCRGALLPRDKLEPWTMPSRGSTPKFTRNGDHECVRPRGTLRTMADAARAPRSSARKVDVRRHDRVSTIATRQACSPHSTGARRPLLPRPDEPFELTEIQVSRRQGATTEAATNRRSTNRRPDNRSPTEHRANSSNCLPPPDVLATRRERARNHQVPALHEQAFELPRRRSRSAHPGSGSTQLTPDGRSRGCPQRQHHLFRKQEKRAPHERPRATGHADVAIAVWPPLVSRSHNEAASIHTCSDSGRMPFARAHGRKTAVTTASGDDPLLVRPSAATTQVPSKLGVPSFQTSCSRPGRARSTAPARGFWPLTGSASPAAHGSGPQEDPHQTVSSPNTNLCENGA